ncbi:MAG TPA: hypothetical protein HA237_03415 [Candidatus Diapherotrites archaeon]|uniref:Uncharacterized protein n=1 Tax=Candidatus Iainarchaeum sp. TaxID=3101447 RepID=A0A7J4IS93_9ARCH|nr:hypothetical protein [Candidatus Diapherotrites archaeon]
MVKRLKTTAEPIKNTRITATINKMVLALRLLKLIIKSIYKAIIKNNAQGSGV